MKLCKWKDILTIVNGKSQKSVEDSRGSYPIYGSGGIIGYAKEFLCPENTVILGRKGSINNPIFVREKVWNVDTAFGLVARQEVLCPLYLYYFCVYFNFEMLNTTVTIPSLTKANLLDITIKLPTLEEQKKISTRLSNIDCIVRNKKQQLSTLDVLVKARFVEMFGDMASNLKQWDVARIRDVVTDVRYGTSRPAVDNGMYKYLRMNNITYSGELDLTNIKRIDIPENELDKCTVRYGDVLFNRTNSKELVGKTCVYNIDEMMVLAGFIIRIRLDESVLPEFFVAFLNTDFSKKMLFDISKDSIGQANINAQELQNIKIYIPPIMYQQEFVNFKKQVEKTKQVIRQSLEKLETLKKSLMQEYFG